MDEGLGGGGVDHLFLPYLLDLTPLEIFPVFGLRLLATEVINASFSQCSYLPCLDLSSIVYTLFLRSSAFWVGNLALSSPACRAPPPQHCRSPAQSSTPPPPRLR
jgi:hypothetical protein